MTIPRHLAPTVGPSASAAGVFIRTGLTTTTGERVASGLIWRFGSLDCISDNAGCFADRPFPAGGNVISFGGFDVYVATVAPPRYPREIVRCASPPPGAGASLTTAGPCIMQEVMATGDDDTSKTIALVSRFCAEIQLSGKTSEFIQKALFSQKSQKGKPDDVGDKSTRVRGPELERTNRNAGASGSGPKAPAPPSRLDEVRAKLSSPLTAGADPSVSNVILPSKTVAIPYTCGSSDDVGDKSTRVRGPELERTNRNAGASGSGPKAPAPPSRLDEVWAKLSCPLTAGADPSSIEKDLEAHRQLLLKQAEELSAAKRQMEITQRVQPRSRLHANRRQPKPSRPDPPVGRRPGRGDRQGRRRIAGSFHGATRLQHPRQERAGSRRRRAEPPPRRRVTPPDEAGNRADQRGHQAVADPRYAMPPELLMLAALQATTDGPRDTAESASPHQAGTSRNTHASSSRTSRPPSGNSGRSRPPSSRREEGDSETATPAPRVRGTARPAHSRLGPRIEPADARDRLDRLVESRIAEEEGPAGPKCFGPRILNEPMIDGFQLPRDTPKYDGTAKPEDWLQDYSTAVGIAKGNKRWAVRYSPLMLLGSARTWLNNLPAGSINGWLDFEEAFISNFTGTYRRSGRPQQLEMCKQGPDETVHT
ncbi:hypothetical protein QYE76_062234 [Lolium multiflorum]|uniref:Retrotransposon gag domain-containing protein n=1 Tax=Lolium multiflorum TaxID=4521 RepID=A0AAD8S2M2_LOLMU|nr:hypothetical protein QYE76_062234 [Lolium multiflorum]